MRNKAYCEVELRREYKTQAEVAEKRVKNRLLEWLEKDYLSESEMEDLAKYNKELKEEILYLTGE